MKNLTLPTRTITLLLVSGFLAGVASGCGRPCTEGTLLLNVKLLGMSTLPSGTQVKVSATYLKAIFTTSFPLKTEGTVEIDFPSGFAYEANQPLELTALALAGDIEVAQGTGHYQLSGTCLSDNLILNATATGDMMAPIDGPAGLDSGGLDFAPADSAPPVDLETHADLSPPPDMTQGPNCVGLAPTCGPAGTDNCCQSPVVTGGSFAMGYDKASDGAYPSPGTPATVSDFRLDKYEITVGRFRQFVQAGKGTQTSAPVNGAGGRTLNGMAGQGGWDATNWNGNLPADTATLKTALKCDNTWKTWTDTATATSESLPINCVNWYEAMAFCIWDGGFLPTEAEWHYAASGGSDQRAYPWSSPPASPTIDCSYANYFSSPSYCVNGTTGGVNRVGSESTRGDGKYGQSDLAGNVDEWVLDWYPTSGSGYPITPCNNCANLTSASYRVYRGDSFFHNASFLRAAYRSETSPGARDPRIGARCARTQ